MAELKIPETWHLFDEVHVPYRILLLAKMLDKATAQQLRDEAGLTLAEWRVIAHTAVLEEASASEIAAAAAVDRAEVSRATSSLEKAGLIKRSPDPNNRKRQLIVLTSAGHALHKRTRLSRVKFFKDITATLTPQEYRTLDKTLLKIARQTEALER
jgi:DNA-binding MarR family transcriptional regulator